MFANKAGGTFHSIFDFLASITNSHCNYLGAAGMAVTFAATIQLSNPASHGAAFYDDGLQFATGGPADVTTVISMDQAARMIHWPMNIPNLGSGLKIGLIDGRVNVNHPALAGQDIRIRDFRTGPSLPIPMDHATAVAALLVGSESSEEFRGLLPNATLYSANIFSLDRDGNYLGDRSAFQAAVRWMIDEGVSVINVSLTGRDDPLVAAAVADAISHGVQVVAAAGNNRDIAGRDFPAAYDGVLSATAVDAQYEIYAYASVGRHVDFAAPGVALRVAVADGNQVLSGTSFAAPFLTAAVALTARDFRRASAGSNSGANSGASAYRRNIGVRDLGQAGFDVVFGRGIIDFADRMPHAKTLSRGPAPAYRGIPAGPRFLNYN